MPRMHEYGLTWRQVIRRDLAAELYPGATLAVQLLQHEALAAEQAAAEALLQRDAGRDAGRAAHPAMPVHQVRVATRDIDWHDMAGHFGCEADRPGPVVTRQEQPAAAHHPLQAAHKTATAARIHGLRHLNARRHPGQLAVRGHDILPRVQRDL